MLSITLHRQLAALVSDVHQLLSSIEAGAGTPEVELRVADIQRALDSLAATTGLGPTGSFNTFARHLHWLLRRHREERPDLYAPDLVDIRERDLPGVIKAVEEWAGGLLDPRLKRAIEPSWTAQQYGSAVRDAFICLEDILRDIGNVDPARGLSGERLVASVLDPNGSDRIALPSDGFLGELTSGERSGFHHLVRGAFLLIRNATAHRPIAYTQSEAEDIVHLVNVCLRLLPEPLE